MLFLPWANFAGKRNNRGILLKDNKKAGMSMKNTSNGKIDISNLIFRCIMCEFRNFQKNLFYQIFTPKKQSESDCLRLNI